MDLWIRSQDREILTPINKPITYWINEEGRYSIVYKESPSYIITLGAYQTKERALEVLDEIQKYINSDITFNLDVYQMPQE